MRSKYSIVEPLPRLIGNSRIEILVNEWVEGKIRKIGRCRGWRSGESSSAFIAE